MQMTKKRLYNIDEVKKLAKLNEYLILRSFDIQVYGNRTNCACPIHGGDCPTGFSYSLDKHVWSCFTNQCHIKYGNDIIGFVKGMLDCNFMDAINYINGVLSNDKTNINTKAETRKIEIVENPVIKQLELRPIDSKFIKNGRFSIDTLNYFGVGRFQSAYDIHKRIMTPIYNDKNKLIAYSGRSIYDHCEVCNSYHQADKSCHFGNFKVPKWMNYPKNFRKSLCLFNLNNVLKDKKPYVIFTEGVYDAFAVHQSGYTSVVATLGISVSKYQIDLLRKYNIKNVYLMYDGNEAGTLGSKSVSDKLLINGVGSTIIKLPPDKDPAKLTNQELNQLICQTIH